ncbi:MAG: Fe-S cluster assembly protein SufD [Chloroflexi bacterium]|nr:Fe-S cluster assembly protein SufD [Chloroflexota bacterium]
MSNINQQPVMAQEEIPEFSFVAHFKLLQKKEGYLKQLQQSALDKYCKMPFPNTKTPGWRKISLRELRPEVFTLHEQASSRIENVNEDSGSGKFENVIYVKLESDAAGSRLSIDNHIVKALHVDIVKDRSDFIPENIIGKIGQIVTPDSDKFAAFSYAFSNNHVVISIEDNCNLTRPVYFDEIINGDKIAIPNTTLLYVGKNSSATLIRERRSGNCTKIMNVGIMEIYLDENAHLDLIDIQDNSHQTWDFQNQKASLQKDASINWFSLLKGCEFSKSRLEVSLNGQGSSAIVSGLFIPTAKQQIFMDTAQNHMAKNTTSDLLYRGVVDGESRSMWEGMIYVDEKAIHTDGYQANNNLVLSRTAKIDSTPGLEILTNDVRCSHGVTITNLDKEQLFYLESRGIPDKTGEALIISGFVQTVIDRVVEKEIQQFLWDEFISKINKDML